MAFLLIWLASLALAVAVARLVPIYAVVVLEKLPTLVGAFLAADIGVQALALVTVVGICVLVAHQVRAAWDDVGPVIGDALARHQIRLAVIRNGIPLATVGATYVLVYTILGTYSLFSILVIADVAVDVGLDVRALALLFLRTRYRLGGRRGGVRRPRGGLWSRVPASRPTAASSSGRGSTPPPSYSTPTSTASSTRSRPSGRS